MQRCTFNVDCFAHLLPPCANLCSAMEYASGGELFDRIVRANRFSEDEARYFFQQLISGVAWCHKEVRCTEGLLAGAEGVARLRAQQLLRQHCRT